MERFQELQLEEEEMAQCLKAEVDAHGRADRTLTEDVRVCERLARLADPTEEQELFPVLEWNVTSQGLPSEAYVNPAWSSDQVIVLRGGGSEFGAYGKWDDKFLLERTRSSERFMVRHARFKDGVYHFNHQDRLLEEVSFPQFVERVGAGEQLYLAETPVHQLGLTRDDRNELYRDLAPSHRLADLLRGILPVQCQPHRHQLWMGRGLKINPLHQDPYDNLLLMIAGTKRFTLFAPSQRWWLYPVFPAGGHESSRMNDIRDIDSDEFPCFKYAHSVEVTLHAGDVLLLPYGWWHQVQTEGEFNLAVNYWWTRGGTVSCAPWPANSNSERRG